MKKLYILCLLGLAGCTTNPLNINEPNRPVATEETSIYYANETPMPAHTAWQGASGAKGLLDNFATCESASEANEVTVNGKKFKSSTRCHLDLLSNSDSETYVRSLSGSTKGQILTSSLSVEGQSYEVTMLWSKHTWMGSPDDDGLDAARYQIGVGAKIVAKIYNAKAGIDLADISGLAASAETSNLTGSITFKRIGINGKLSEIILPGFTDTLDTDAVINAVQSMQKIQILLHSDEDVTIKPSVLGYVLPRQEEVESEGLGWLYIGHYPTETSLLVPKFKITSVGNKKVNELLDTTIKLASEKNIRADKPRFPYYTVAQAVTTVPVGCQLKINQIDSVGQSKYWAYVSAVQDCE
ncbi:hypothetical protein HR060_15280 [Catenovulum sp. SM1970]|uniref:hypothetical protein n=1 Tax=Marinifaba aquimaris TaxID=2741323 RepID=UPI001571B08A|nr:hypothetical protein [Marinifaba aquimaris]NTS78213.1 hypothetical protein [Marinifaba aquimaris]